MQDSAKKSAIVEDEAMEGSDCDSENEEDEAAGGPVDENMGADDEWASHGIGCPSTPKDHVVTLQGYSFRPRARRNTQAKREEHALAALLCFVPFDSLTRDEILRGHETYEAAFEDALAEGWVCELGRWFLENLEIYWDMKFAAQERKRARCEAARGGRRK